MHAVPDGEKFRKFRSRYTARPGVDNDSETGDKIRPDNDLCLNWAVVHASINLVSAWNWKKSSRTLCTSKHARLPTANVCNQNAYAEQFWAHQISTLFQGAGRVKNDAMDALAFLSGSINFRDCRLPSRCRCCHHYRYGDTFFSGFRLSNYKNMEWKKAFLHHHHHHSRGLIYDSYGLLLRSIVKLVSNCPLTAEVIVTCGATDGWTIAAMVGTIGVKCILGRKFIRQVEVW